jgi:hypothetical protein
MFKSVFFNLKVMPDNDYRLDMEELKITCSFCDWNDVFKDYQLILFDFSVFKEHLDITT